MKDIVVTNNKTIEKQDVEIVTVDGEFRDVLVKARDMIHAGHKLLVSPLPASIRMFYSPVRSVVVSHSSGEMDLDSVSMIENAINLYDKSMGTRNVDYVNQSDYEVLDYELLQSALAELRAAEL